MNSLEGENPRLNGLILSIINGQLRLWIWFPMWVERFVGKMLEVDLRWGGNWDMDGEPITDQDFQDLVHFEEVK